MNCIFKPEECVYSMRDSHDDCRKCKNVPDMDIESEVENRLLSSVAGQREKQKQQYGSVKAKDPKWVKALIKKNRGMGDHIPCTDHRRNLNEMVINEPYDVHMEAIKKLIVFCEENGLSFMIDGRSAHFPGKCFRILITKLKTASDE